MKTNFMVHSEPIKTYNGKYICYEIKHVFHAFIAWWKPKQMFGRIREHISENPITFTQETLTFMVEIDQVYGSIPSRFVHLLNMFSCFEHIYKSHECFM